MISPEPGQPAGDAYDWVQRARVLHEEGNPAAAAELLAHAAAREPSARSVREAWARALFDARRYDDAAREFLALTELAPDDHYAHFGAGMALWRLQRFTAAAEHLTVATAMRPGRAEYETARRQVRATLAARADAGLPADGPLPADGSAGSETLGEPGPAATPAPRTEQALTREHDVELLDLDGVVYRGPAALPHAAACLSAARQQGMRLAFVTNNAARSPAAVAAHLGELGVDVEPAEVATSAQAGARLAAERVPAGARVLAVGGPGVAAALEAVGLRPCRPGDGQDTDAVAAVMMGFGPDVSWRDLAAASYAIQNGAVLIATNTDRTIPTAHGIAPGNGTLVAAVRAATGAEPLVAGKPFPPLMSYAIAQCGAERPLVVGDRLDTDIEGAHALGLPSLLVLTGVTGVAELLRAAPEQRPTYLAADLRGLLARGRRIVADPSVVVDESGQLHLGDPDGGDALAGLRAAAAACWAAADSGGAAPRWTDADLERLRADVARELAG